MCFNIMESLIKKNECKRFNVSTVSMSKTVYMTRLLKNFHGIILVQSTNYNVPIP